MEWVSVRERLPNVKERTYFLVWLSNGTWLDWVEQEGIPDFLPNITHWVEIKPPEAYKVPWYRKLWSFINTPLSIRMMGVTS